MVVLYPTVIQPLFNKLSPLAEGELRTRIEALASKLKFPLKHLYELDGSKRSSHSNAYFFGLPWVCIFSFACMTKSCALTCSCQIDVEQAHCYLWYPHPAEQGRRSRGCPRYV